MTYETLLKKFNEKKVVKFKLYSLDYVVEQTENYVEIKASYYE